MKKTTPQGDTTQTRRGARRTAALNKKAGDAGYFYKGKPSWSAYGTAVLNGLATIPPNKTKSTATNLKPGR